MHSVHAFTAATSSASADDNVTFFWVALQDFKRCCPSIIAPPLVDLAVRLQPAQSASEWASMSGVAHCHPYFHTNLRLPFKYQPILFNISHAQGVGLDISRHTSVVAC